METKLDLTNIDNLIYFNNRTYFSQGLQLRNQGDGYIIEETKRGQGKGNGRANTVMSKKEATIICSELRNLILMLLEGYKDISEDDINNHNSKIEEEIREKIEERMSDIREYNNEMYKLMDPIAKKLPKGISDLGAGYVYLLEDNDKFYKIGKSRNLRDRFRTLYKENYPEHTLKFKGAIYYKREEDYHQKELDWHNKFSDKRIGRTEWFTLDNTEIQLFMGYTTIEEVL